MLVQTTSSNSSPMTRRRRKASHDTPCSAVTVMCRLQLCVSPQGVTFPVDTCLNPLLSNISHLFLHDWRPSHLSSTQYSHARSTDRAAWWSPLSTAQANPSSEASRLPVKDRADVRKWRMREGVGRLHLQPSLRESRRVPVAQCVLGPVCRHSRYLFFEVTVCQ